MGFRNWLAEDLPTMAKINADNEVMAYFPAPVNVAGTSAFIERMQAQYAEKNYCYFAVDLLVDQTFIGFIGLNDQSFHAEFTQYVDIGWRLDKKFWHNGYASEGAKKCLEYAFQELNLGTIQSIAPTINLPSIQVMKKIGMEKLLTFKHPKLKNDTRLENCVCYQIDFDHNPSQ